MRRAALIFLATLGIGFSERPLEQKTVEGNVYAFDSGKPLEGVLVKSKSTGKHTKTNMHGDFRLLTSGNGDILIFSLAGYEPKEVQIAGKFKINVALIPTEVELEPDVTVEEESLVNAIRYESVGVAQKLGQNPYSKPMLSDWSDQNFNTEEYDVINENIFHNPKSKPLSTFSIDVDAASYSNLRRMINYGQVPHKDVVRIEEMINYFTYDYENPKGEHPFSIQTEMAPAPWNNQHQLVHIGIQGKKVNFEDLGKSNLVFLIDVSGSMADANKLPLLKNSMKLLVNELQPDDRVAIVVYAGAAGLVLPSTAAKNREIIFNALNNLEAGGSTAGGEGIKLAYRIAEENLIKDGNNRIILATDGDFNVGASSTAEMVRLIEEKRKTGIYLTITGFGMGNYKDGRMEQISNAGNGNYYYIDNIGEAKKVFVTDLRGTLFTIAKDVKIQVEFNPRKVQAYRLIGYENRKLNDEDFNDDTKDAGELGAGHTVTALYEIIPVGIKSSFIKPIDELKYQPGTSEVKANPSGEWLTVKFRYKKPNEEKSNLIQHTVEQPEKDEMLSDNFRFSAAVAEFGMLLRDSEFKSDASYDNVLNLAKNSKGEDPEGYRTEFIALVKNVMILTENN